MFMDTGFVRDFAGLCSRARTVLWFTLVEQVISYISDIEGQTEYLDYLPNPRRVSNIVFKRDHGNLFHLNYLFVKIAFALVNSSFRPWQIYFS